MVKKMGNGVVYVNGIYLTPEAVDSLDYMQTGGTISNGVHDREFTNEGLNSFKTDLCEANKIIIEAMCDEVIKKKKAVTLLRLINDVTFYLDKLAAPAIEKKAI